MVVYVGAYSDGAYESCAIAYPEGGPIEGECYTHADGDPECRFRIEGALRVAPLFSADQRASPAWRFIRVDAEPRAYGERMGFFHDRRLPRPIRRMNPLMRPQRTGDKEVPAHE